VDDYIRIADRKPGDFLLGSRCGRGGGITTRQYARLVAGWAASIGLDPSRFGTHSLRRTKTTLIYRRTDNLRAVQLLLCHSKIEISAPSVIVFTADGGGPPDARPRLAARVVIARAQDQAGG
jgi:integrase